MDLSHQLGSFSLLHCHLFLGSLLRGNSIGCRGCGVHELLTLKYSANQFRHGTLILKHQSEQESPGNTQQDQIPTVPLRDSNSMLLRWGSGISMFDVCYCSVLSDSCNPRDCISPDSSVHEILQARILEWLVISFSRRSSQPRDQIRVSCIAGKIFTVRVPREAPYA